MAPFTSEMKYQASCLAAPAWMGGVLSTHVWVLQWLPAAAAT